MYFCYVDESGDCGQFDANNPQNSGSAYFILVGLIVASAKWKLSLDILKSFRKQLARESYLPYNIEFHCADMIDPHKTKAFTSISVPDRWKLIERYAALIGNQASFSVVTVVIDKVKSKLMQADYLTAAITKLYQAFDEFLKIEKESGLLFFDRANEKHINTHVRKLLGTGASGETILHANIDRIIEDPIFRVSSDSMFIQSADVVAYTLKEMIFPQASRKKYQADMIFKRKLQNALFKSKIAEMDGVIRI